MGDRRFSLDPVALYSLAKQTQMNAGGWLSSVQVIPRWEVRPLHLELHVVQDRLRLPCTFSIPREGGAAQGQCRLACLHCRQLRRLLDVLQL